MKAKLIMGALLSTTLMIAQTNETKPEAKKQATVRIKKVENINGIEKITDTTYTTSDPALMKLEEMHFDQKGDSKTKQVIIIDDGNDPKISDADRKKELEKIMNEMDEKNRTEVERMTKEIIENHKSGRTCISKTVTIRIELEEPNEADLKKIVKENGETDRKLKVEELRFFPSPSNGKSVNLSFELAEKGDALVSVLNMEGKAVFTEKLGNFTGKYNKTIDISNNAKGIYFVRVEQGKHAEVKKIVLE